MAWTSCLANFLTLYETPRLVLVHNVFLGLTVRISQLLVLAYILLYAVYQERGYQEFAAVESSVTVKVKGVSRSHVSDSLSIYNRVWDPADYVVPSAENGAFFITTNVVVTANQSLSRCGESLELSHCNVDADCVVNHTLDGGHGPMTGKCLLEEQTCQIEAWCPVEKEDLHREPLEMDNVLNYTVFVKNSVAFPRFGAKYRRNNVIPGPKPSLYDAKSNPWGQIFVVGDMLREADRNHHLDIDKLLTIGGVLSLAIDWNCNLDLDFEKHCRPTYNFHVLDYGYNFRHAMVHEYDRRTLIKAYGLRFVIIVSGAAGKFSLRNALLNVGNGLALLGITTIIGEFLLLHVTKEKGFVVRRKYVQCEEEGEEMRESEHKEIKDVLHENGEEEEEDLRKELRLAQRNTLC